MPLYEYQCQECGLRFERRQHFNDEPVKTCPDCEGAVVRLIHPAGIIFKGSGFYVTDNRAKSSTAIPGRKSEESSSDSSNSSTSSTTESTSSESKKEKSASSGKEER